MAPLATMLCAKAVRKRVSELHRVAALTPVTRMVKPPLATSTTAVVVTGAGVVVTVVVASVKKGSE
jgi:hypothetical protein